jgi:hypothetical protein
MSSSPSPESSQLWTPEEGGLTLAIESPTTLSTAVPRAIPAEHDTKGGIRVYILHNATGKAHFLFSLQGTLDWTRQWYALSFVDYLDPKKPHKRELLGVRLVLWRDSRGLWRCFEDKCPHRLAPLSGQPQLNHLSPTLKQLPLLSCIPAGSMLGTQNQAVALPAVCQPPYRWSVKQNCPCPGLCRVQGHPGQ